MLFNFYQTAIFVFLSLLVVAVFSFRSVWDELDFFPCLSSLIPLETPSPFTSLRSVTVGSGRDFLEGDTRVEGNRKDYCNASALNPFLRVVSVMKTPPLSKLRRYALLLFHGLALDDQ